MTTGIVIKMKTQIFKYQRTLILSPDLEAQFQKLSIKEHMNILSLENVHNPRVIHFSLFWII